MTDVVLLSEDADAGHTYVEIPLSEASTFHIGQHVIISDDNWTDNQIINSIDDSGIYTVVYFTTNLNHNFKVADNAKISSISTPVTGYTGGPYVSLGTINNYAIPIGPLNIPYSRLTDALDTIMTETITASFIPWEWWFDYTGQLMVAETRGSDKSASVSFVAAINIGRATKYTSSKQTAQRVRTVGRGESAEQDQNTSDWYDDITEMENVGTFYEKLDVEKSLTEKDKSDIWSQIILAQDAPLRQEITVIIENNPYTSNDFDVGDTVGVTDPDVPLSGKYRVKTIDEVVVPDVAGGETTTLTLSNVRTDISDRLSNLFKVLERLQHSSTYIDVMYAEGARQRKLDANVIEDVWEQTASNKWALELPANEADDPQLDYCKYGVQAHVDYRCDKDVFEIYSSDVGSYGHVYLAEPTLKFSRNPRFTCEFEVDTTSGDGTEWTAYDATDGDIVWFRIAERNALCGGADPDNPSKYCCEPYGGGIGFGFEVIRTTQGYMLKATLGDGISTSKVTVARVEKDIKYVVEARMEWTEKVVKFYFGKSDVDKNDLEWGFRLRAILPINLSASDCDNLYPFYITLQAHGATSVSKQAFFIYRWKTQAIRAVEA